jgi:hypothetical protein
LLGTHGTRVDWGWVGNTAEVLAGRKVLSWNRIIPNSDLPSLPLYSLSNPSACTSLFLPSLSFRKQLVIFLCIFLFFLILEFVCYFFIVNFIPLVFPVAIAYDFAL